MTKSMQAILNKIPQSRKSKLAASLRKNRDEIAYITAQKSGNSKPLVAEPRMMEWTHWALIDNKFPYSAVFKTHHMLIPKREVSEKLLTTDEKEELQCILDELSDIYDCHLVNFKKKQSKQSHYHIHLLTYKDYRKHLRF